MDNDIKQNNFQPVNNTPAPPQSNKKGINSLLKAVMLLIILILIAGGVYMWQHSKVTKLTSSQSSLNSEINSDNQKIASLNSKLATSKPSSSTTSGVSACTNSEIKLTETPSAGAAGNEAGALVFTNDSTSSCTLYGYPLIQYLDKNGKVVGNVDEELTGGMIFPTVSPAVITLAANQQASVGLNWTEGGANQSTAATTDVYLPGSNTPLTISKAIGPSTANTGDSFDILVTAFQTGSSPKLTN